MLCRSGIIWILQRYILALCCSARSASPSSCFRIQSLTEALSRSVRVLQVVTVLLHSMVLMVCGVLLEQIGLRASATKVPAERLRDRTAGLRMSYDSAVSSTRSSFLSRKPLMHGDLDEA